MDFRFDPELHRYFINGRRVTGITEALRLAGISDPVPERGHYLRNFKYAGDRGIAVHKMCELDDLGQAELFDMDENLLGYLEAWRGFKRELKFVPALVETPLGHEVLQFGGTFDVQGEIPGAQAVIERKSRKLSDHDDMQVEAQALLIRDSLGLGAQAKFLVELHADGTYLWRRVENRTARSVFLNAVGVANYRIGRGDE